MIFHKNKRIPRFCLKRRVFAVMFLLFVVSFSAVVTILYKAKAQLEPVKSVEIFSEHTSYENNEAGSWKITKSAEWIKTGKAQVTFEVKSVGIYGNKKNVDILLVIDNSGSMEGDKIHRVIVDSTELADSILDNPENRIGLVTFESWSEKVLDFTNNKDAVIDAISSIETGDCTNYYRGLVEAEKVIGNYQPQDDRQLMLLFLTDGYPNEEVPNEIAQYKTLKARYPYMVINGIQYEMGDVVLQPIINVSDNQFIADMSSLRNVLFEASRIPFSFDNFVITDYIEDTYWSIGDESDIIANFGTTTLSYNGTTPVITWDMSERYISGQAAILTIDLNLKEEYYSSLEELLLPTNKHESIFSKILDSPDEQIDSDLTPILKDYYAVEYIVNPPSDCEISGEVPPIEYHAVFSPVAINGYNNITCSGYHLVRWDIQTPGVDMINDDYFRMPEHDVVLVSIWGKPSISKSMDGTPHTYTYAMFDTGKNFLIKIKKLSGQSVSTSNYYYSNNTIKAIQRATQLPGTFDENDNNHVVSAADSPALIHAWFDDGTIYYYYAVEKAYINPDASYMFGYLGELTDISGLADIDTSKMTNMMSMFSSDQKLENINPITHWNTKKVTNMGGVFSSCYKLVNIDAVNNWSTSNVTNMARLFSSTAIVDISPVRNWNTSNVTSMSETFYSADMTNIDALSNWDTSKVTNMSGMFGYCSSLTNIGGAANWDTSKVTDMSKMFYQNYKLYNINGAINWNTSSVTTMETMFGWASGLYDINGAANWDVSHVTTMYQMFSSTDIYNIDALVNWKTTSLKNMSYMFSSTELNDVDGAANWDTSHVTNMSSLFLYARGVYDLSGMKNWDTSSVTNMSGMFQFVSWYLYDVDDLAGWDTSSVTNMSSMFNGAEKLILISGLSSWNTQNVTDMSYMFSGTRVFKLDDISGWNTSRLTNMSGMFSNDLSDINGIKDWNVSKVTSMNSLFSGSEITNIDVLNGWNTQSLKSMSGMFSYTEKLTNINGAASWDTSNVTDMSSLFYGSTRINNISAMANWNTNKVTNMNRMFSGASNLSNISALAEKNTANVTNMSYMFYNASGISDFSPIDTFNTANVTNMSYMFSGATGLTGITSSNTWNTSKVTNMSEMFSGATSLANIEGLSGWNVSKVTNMSKMFYNDSTIISLEPLYDWITTALTNKTDIFTGVPEGLERPGWAL